MFGLNDKSNKNNDDSAMLENVKQLANQPAGQVEPNQISQSPTTTPTTAVIEPSQTNKQEQTPVPAKKPPISFANSPLTTPSPSNHATPTTNKPATNNHVAPSSPFAPSLTVSSDDEDNDNNVNVQEPTDDTPSISLPEEPKIELPSKIDHKELSNMKQQALDHLEPLVDHLDQTAEESFKTTMMMIQANDNHTLLGKALASAKEIKDDKIRAQAMLDIINEINYFSQKAQNS